MLEMNKLRQKIEWLKHASVFEKTVAAESLVYTALSVLEDVEKRLQKLEDKANDD